MIHNMNADQSIPGLLAECPQLVGVEDRRADGPPCLLLGELSCDFGGEVVDAPAHVL